MLSFHQNHDDKLNAKVAQQIPNPSFETTNAFIRDVRGRHTKLKRKKWHFSELLG
jgi:hypothetical protein